MALRHWRRSRAAAVANGSVAAARDDGETLVGTGRLVEVIDLLTEVNRRQRDPKIEEQLVQLRLDAFTPGSCSPAPPERSLVTGDLFGSGEPPEVSAVDLTPETLRRAILGHGCLLVRGLVEGSRIDRLVDDIDQAFAGYDAHLDGTPVAETAPWYVPFGAYPDPIDREWVRAGGGVLAVDSPRALFDVIETFEESGIGELATAYLGGRPALLAKKWTLRRMHADQCEPGESHGSGDAGWHQDGAFMGQNIRSLDVWLTLSDCGDDAPGLDIVAQRLDHIVETGTDGTRFDWTVAPSVAERTAQGSIVSPIFAPGDALLFDHLLLHRTGVHDGMTRDRYAIEAWFAAPSNYPADMLPIVY